jgi:hypothetical protein
VRDFEDSTLWRVSEYERMREATGSSGFARLGRESVLSSTLLADLGRIHDTPRGMDVLEVVAACMRQREPALLLLEHEQLVWPLTVFPAQMMVHSPTDFVAATRGGLGSLRLVSIEPPGVRPPGHWRNDRVADLTHYRPLQPVLWRLALQGPRRTLLDEIAGAATYRVVRRDGEPLDAPGALGPAIARLHDRSSTLAEIAHWPGMGTERACRMLNALYLNTSLMVLRARAGTGTIMRSWLRPRR